MYGHDVGRGVRKEKEPRVVGWTPSPRPPSVQGARTSSGTLSVVTSSSHFNPDEITIGGQCFFICEKVYKLNPEIQYHGWEESPYRSADEPGSKLRMDDGLDWSILTLHLHGHDPSRCEDVPPLEESRDLVRWTRSGRWTRRGDGCGRVVEVREADKNVDP